MIHGQFSIRASCVLYILAVMWAAGIINPVAWDCGEQSHGNQNLGSLFPDSYASLEKIPITNYQTISDTDIHSKGLWVYVDSLYSTYLVVQIRLSYDDSIYLVIEIMTYDKEFFMKDKKKEEKVKIHVQR